MIKLMIADDDAKVRSAINLLLDQDKACWQVVAEVRYIEELFDKLEKEKPQLLLLDWELPEECCGDKKLPESILNDRIANLRILNKDMYIIVLSSEPQVKTEALNAGANSFVSKGDPPEVFLKALYEVCEQPVNYFFERNKKKSVHRNFVSIFL